MQNYIFWLGLNGETIVRDRLNKKHPVYRKHGVARIVRGGRQCNETGISMEWDL